MSSLAEFRMPITGLVLVQVTGWPAARMAARCSRPTSSSRPNQRSLRRAIALYLDAKHVGEPLEETVDFTFGLSIEFDTRPVRGHGCWE